MRLRWRARKSGSVAGLVLASASATNSSGSRVGNLGEVCPRRSVAVPSGSFQLTAMPRTSGLGSAIAGFPPPFDQRTTTGTVSPLRCPARESSVA